MGLRNGTDECTAPPRRRRRTRRFGVVTEQADPQCRVEGDDRPDGTDKNATVVAPAFKRRDPGLGIGEKRSEWRLIWQISEELA